MTTRDDIEGTLTVIESLRMKAIRKILSYLKEHIEDGEAVVFSNKHNQPRNDIFQSIIKITNEDGHICFYTSEGLCKRLESQTLETIVIVYKVYLDYK